MPDQLAPGSLASNDSDSSQWLDDDVPFRALFESAPSLCLVLTPDEFTIVAVSEAYLVATMTNGRQLWTANWSKVFLMVRTNLLPDACAICDHSLSAWKRGPGAAVWQGNAIPGGV